MSEETGQALSALLAKLEAATQGSHNLTADVYEALGCEVIRAPKRPNGIAWRYRGQGPSGRIADRWEVMQRLTESLDAAMTLVEGYWGPVLLAAIDACDLRSDLPRFICIASIRARLAGQKE